MNSYKMSDRFEITGTQLVMLHALTGYDEQATEIVKKVLEQKVEVKE